MPSTVTMPSNAIRSGTPIRSRRWLGGLFAFVVGAAVVVVVAPMVRQWTVQPVEPLGCLCYRSAAARGSAPMTVCRRSLYACDQLRADVEGGGVVGADPESLGPACTVVYGEHPGDVLGGRGAWENSSKKGGFVSHAGCLLSPQGGEPSQAW